MGRFDRASNQSASATRLSGSAFPGQQTASSEPSPVVARKPFHLILREHRLRCFNTITLRDDCLPGPQRPAGPGPLPHLRLDYSGDDVLDSRGAGTSGAIDVPLGCAGIARGTTGGLIQPSPPQHFSPLVARERSDAFVKNLATSCGLTCDDALSVDLGPAGWRLGLQTSHANSRHPA